ncbi:hypothetical protein CB0940_03259 [Cercospora beticola]|uniref:Microbial-type PARG catalytic domain-containing protein n=1 Tax=Cercospora beticola TaxID=122368 RepID=A0A2G5I1P8_CERBT|nr:hypothetical protein CB0940_03259 [Cercospora beticola]PIA98735.1 hypothetical protein CB0940_03259 [Cercospora beticola]WPB00432.1 hypothetical protein RHO25_005051 [Cercospora beticola]CAK1361355.1 unnamed protein product [Cercospora beticola]
MGRAEREERESRARQTIARAIPEALRSSIKAKHGVMHSELIDDPQIVVKSPQNAATAAHPSHLSVRIESGGCLDVARKISYRHFVSSATRRSSEEQPNVGVHNMGSTTVRGGGFLRGVGGQEEYLCARTTLYESLSDDFYMLPVKGGVYSPDILVFRDDLAEEYKKKQRFFVDVITAGTFKHPREGRSEDVEGACSCGVSYCDDHRSIMMQKMKAVLRIAQMKGTKRLILGAWGVGPLNHPVEEVAKLWRKVISGAQRQRRPNAEQWEGIDEIIFALTESSQRKAFEKHFHDVMTYEPLERVDSATTLEDEMYARTPDANLVMSAQNIELRIEETKNAYSRARLKEELRAINHQIANNRKARAYKDDDDANEAEDLEDDFVVAGYPASDGEEHTYYTLADTTTDSASDAEDARSEIYEFRFGGPGISDSTADEDDELDGHVWVAYANSPNYNNATGWYNGSIDELHNMDKEQRRIRGSVSPRSPLAREMQVELKSEQPPLPKSSTVDGLLERFRRTDVVDQSE